MANYTPTLTPQPYAGVGKAALIESFPVPGDTVLGPRGPFVVSEIRILDANTFIVAGDGQNDGRPLVESLRSCAPVDAGEAEDYANVQALRDTYRESGLDAAAALLRQIIADATST